MTKAGSAQHDAATGDRHADDDLRGGRRRAAPARRWVRRDRLRLVSADELRGFAEDAGLVVELLAGDYDLGAARARAASAAILDRGQALTDGPPSVTPAPGPPGGRPTTDACVVSSAGWHRATRPACSIVEDVPQVAQYIRGLLNAQAQVKLLDVLTDGAQGASATIQRAPPDVVMVDALLQGRVKGLKLVEQIHEAELGVPVIVLTVPAEPGRGRPRARASTASCRCRSPAST